LRRLCLTGWRGQALRRRHHQSSNNFCQALEIRGPMMRTCKTLLISGIALFIFSASAIAKDTNPWKDQYVKVGDIKIHYIETGSGDRSIVFIPGWMMAAEIWKEQLPYFAARGFRAIALDPRSQGKTTQSEEGNTYRQQAADLHVFLKTLGLEHATLVGWSAGVTVLLEYVTSPEAVRPDNLVFVDGQPMGHQTADYPYGSTMQQARDLILPYEEDRAKAVDKFVRSMFKTRQSEVEYKEIIESCMKIPFGTACALFFDLFTGDRRIALEHVYVPTLIVVPDERRIVGEYMQSKTPKSKLEVVPDAGHALFFEKPQAFNQILESFLGAH
jgi:non-heme chloroperoxidase